MSSLQRVMACPASAVLPQTREVRENPWASRGTVIHAYLRDVSQLGVDEALARVPLEYLEACEELDLTDLPLDPEAYAPEVALAYDWAQDRGREINRGTDSRDYGASLTEVAGRTDVVAVAGDAVRIWDYKTGYRYLGRPDESWQLRGYALAAARAYGRREAEVTFVRIPEDSPPYLITQRLGFLELEETALAIATTAELVEDLAKHSADDAKRLDRHLKAGDWCTYCPAFGRCPEQAGLLREAIAWGAELEQGALRAPVLDTETAPLVYARLKLAQKALEFTKDALRRYAENGAIPVQGSGLVWGPISTPREEFDPVRGAAVLGRLWPDVAMEAIESKPKLTKASLERALRAWMGRQAGKGLRLTKLKESAIDALREGGASIIRRHTECREHRVGVVTDEAAASLEAGT